MQRTDAERDRLNRLSKEIIGAALDVHRELGPGMLESAYKTSLASELTGRGLAIEREKPMSQVYKGKSLGRAYRVDLIIEKSVVVEVKAVERLIPVHGAQLLSYLKHLDLRLGLSLTSESNGSATASCVK